MRFNQYAFQPARLVERAQPLELGLWQIRPQRREVMAHRFILHTLFLVGPTNPVFHYGGLGLHLARAPQVVQSLVIMTRKKQSRSHVTIHEER
jgi:hypothetical protein